MRQAVTEAAVRLRDPVEADYSTLRRLRTDEALLHILLANPDTGGDPDIAGWIARRQAGGVIWSVAEGGDCVGFVQLANIHRKNRTAWLGVALLGDVRGRGVGRAAMEALFEAASARDLRKLLLEVRADNAGAIALYNRLGFRTVGTLEADYDDGTAFHDVVVMERFLA